MRKATNSFFVFVSTRASVRPHGRNNSAPTRRAFHQIWYVSIFRKSVENIQVSLKSYRKENPVILHKHLCILKITCRWIVPRMKNYTYNEKLCLEWKIIPRIKNYTHNEKLYLEWKTIPGMKNYTYNEKLYLEWKIIPGMKNYA